jgi:RNA:NAD 2'-phosphotransferase (TPT1/KptA family)
MISIYQLYLVFLVLSIATTTEVTLSNLQGFFTATYDRDQDGFATLQEFVDYFRFMEPEHNLQEKDIAPIHSFFDADQDHRVTLKELIEIAQIKITTRQGHKQIHIGLTDKDGEMQVMWVSTPEFYNKPIVQYGRLPANWKHEIEGTF